MPKYSVFALVVCALLSSCAREEVTSRLAPPVVPSVDDWTKALKSSFVTFDHKESEDGQQTFYACFGEMQKKKPVCPSGPVSVVFDPFGRMYKFWPASASFSDLTAKYAADAGAYLSFVGVVFECNSAPSVVARMTFSGDSWLFLHSFRVLADGKLVLEKEVPRHEVDREVRGSGVEEVAIAPLGDQDVRQFPALLDSQRLLIRLNGANGYIPLKPAQIKTFRGETATFVRLHEAVSKALASFQASTCDRKK